MLPPQEPQGRQARARGLGLVSGLLKEPERIRAGLERLSEEERRGTRGDPLREQKAWLEKLAEADRRRARFQDMAADGLIAFDELRAKLAALEETRELAQRELGILRDRQERLGDLERDKAALLERYAGMVPGELDDLGPEERNRVYKMLGLGVTVRPSGVLEISGTFGEGFKLSESDPTRASGARSSARPSPTRG
jgi:hypothetical protein